MDTGNQTASNGTMAQGHPAAGEIASAPLLQTHRPCPVAVDNLRFQKRSHPEARRYSWHAQLF